MLKDYFDNYEVKEGYEKEYISLFDGWLGKDNLHKLDEVTEEEWSKFNYLLNEIFNNLKIYSVDVRKNTCVQVENINVITNTYNEAMNKEQTDFTKLIIPEHNCVLTEDWDYTYILWHKNNGTVEALKPLIENAGLYQFNEQSA
jgi:hypothetical protein